MSRLFSVRTFAAVPDSIRGWAQFFLGKDTSRPAATFLEGLYTGTGSPEGVVTAVPGSLYTNASGGAGVTLYVKEANSTAFGWVAK